MPRQPTSFSIKLKLKADLNGDRVDVETNQKVVLLENNQSTTIRVQKSWDNKKISIACFSGFHPNPKSKITIEEVWINDYRVESFRSLFRFEMSNNPYVENKNLEGVSTVNYNGELTLGDDPTQIDRLTWFPNTFSETRSDFVYSNYIINCQSEYGCYGQKDCVHNPPFKVFDSETFDLDSYFDYVALGDSFTAGSGIKKDFSWPSLLRKKGKKVLNLGHPAAGIDTQLINIITLLKKGIKFKKIIVLLPKMTRRLVRIHKNGLWFNLQFYPHMDEKFPPTHFNIYFTKQEYENIMKKTMRKLVLQNEKWSQREEMVIKRMIKLLETNKIDFHLSSWSKETYAILEKHCGDDNLLPMFNKDRDSSTGIDNIHPAEQVHEKWVKSIENRL